MANNQSYLVRYLVFLAFPFITFILSLRNIQNKVNVNIIWLFVIFFTQTMSFVNEDMDNYAYREYLVNVYESNIQSKNDSSLSFRSSDAYVNVLTNIVGNITDSGRFLFLIYGIVFGYFYSRNIRLIVSRLGSSSSLIVFVYVLSLILIVPFWDINGVRMYTAAHVFFYGVLNYSFNRDYKAILIAAASTLIHFSFVFPLLMFVAALFIHSNRAVYILIIIFILSLIFNSLIPLDKSGIVKSIDGFLNLSENIDGYLSDVSIEQYGEKKKTYALHIILFEQFQLVSIGVMMLHIYLTKKLWENQLNFLRVALVTGLLIGIVTALLSGLPSINRFNAISFFFLLGAYLYLSPIVFTKVRLLVYLNLPFLIFWLVVKIRIGFDYLTLNTVLGNVFTMFFEDLNEIVLINFIK